MDEQEKLGRKDHIQNTWSRINSMVDAKQACGPDHSKKGFVDASLVMSVPSTTKGYLEHLTRLCLPGARQASKRSNS